VAGKRLTASTASDKVTGKHVYAATFAARHAVGKILRSSEAHARITRARRFQALALPGVRSVLTAQDIPQIDSPRRSGPHHVRRRRGSLPRRGDRRRVAATSRSRRGGGAAIEIEYEPLAAVFDPEEALRPGAPLVHALERLPGAAGVRPRGQYLGPLCARRRRPRGGFAQSLSHLRARFTTQHVHPGYAEPRARVASWDGNGDVIRLDNTQLLRQEEHAAEVLDLPASRCGSSCRHRGRLRRQAPGRRRALRGMDGAQVAPSRSRC